jgi:hypothetical protein
MRQMQDTAIELLMEQLIESGSEDPVPVRSMIPILTTRLASHASNQPSLTAGA